MPLPENFNSVHHLKQVIEKTRNKLVRDYFREDVDENDLATNEGALKRACLIDPDDTIDIINLKTQLFYLDCGVAYQRFRDEGFYIPKTDFHENYHFKPQIQLKFEETKKDRLLHGKKHPKRFRFSYRLLNESTESFTESKKQSEIIKINQLFPKTWEHYAGLDYYSFYDAKQYDKGVKVPARTQSDALEFIEKLCNLAGITYKSNKITKIDKPLQTKETVTILGEPTIVGSDNQTGMIKLKQACLFLHGMTKQEQIIYRAI